MRCTYLSPYVYVFHNRIETNFTSSCKNPARKPWPGRVWWGLIGVMFHHEIHHWQEVEAVSTSTFWISASTNLNYSKNGKSPLLITNFLIKYHVVKKNMTSSLALFIISVAVTLWPPAWTHGHWSGCSCCKWRHRCLGGKSWAFSFEAQKNNDIPGSVPPAKTVKT